MSRFLLFLLAYSGEGASVREPLPPQPRQPIAPSIRDCLPLRSPSRSGEAHSGIRFCMKVRFGEGLTLPSWMCARFGFPKQSLPAAGGGPQRSDVDRGTRENKRRGCGGGGSHTDALLPRAGRKKPPLPVASFKSVAISAAPLGCSFYIVRANMESAPTVRLFLLSSAS